MIARPEDAYASCMISHLSCIECACPATDAAFMAINSSSTKLFRTIAVEQEYLEKNIINSNSIRGSTGETDVEAVQERLDTGLVARKIGRRYHDQEVEVKLTPFSEAATVQDPL